MNLESFVMMIQGSSPVDDVGWLAWGGKGSIQQKQIMMTKTMMIMVSVSGDCDIGDSLLGDGDGNGDD